MTQNVDVEQLLCMTFSGQFRGSSYFETRRDSNSVVLWHISKPHVHISPNFLYMLPLTVARSSYYGNAIPYVLPVL